MEVEPSRQMKKDKEVKEEKPVYSADSYLAQCSQRSWAPVGPHGATDKSPGRDGATKRGPFWSGKPQDGRHCGGRRALQCKTN